MPRTVLALFTMVLGFPFAAHTQGGSNFSGTWKMDPARSESAHQAVPIGPVTLVINQTALELRIETRRTETGRSDGGESAVQSQILTYRLDGTESTMAAETGAPVKTRAHWNGNKLVTETERNVQGSSVTTMYIHSLDPKGKELTVDKTLLVQHGYQFEGSKSYGTGRDVFVKVHGSSQPGVQ
ncbi:MAG TPA: hypothetical protein VNY05_28515 [Candidatus Acidoferrales bacterium]|jgi:hypothetical protein|nr:hypothetical protein [Candidatus Acidoferrales bacterium]